MKKAFVGFLISLLLSGCASNVTRTGVKTFMLDGYAHKEGLAEKYLNRDASKLCHDQFRIVDGEISLLKRDVWKYVYEVECLGQVNEYFYNCNKKETIYMFFY